MSKWSNCYFHRFLRGHLSRNSLNSRPGALRSLDLPKGPSEEGCFRWAVEHQSGHLSSYCSSLICFCSLQVGQRYCGLSIVPTLHRIPPGVMSHDRGDSKIRSRNTMESNQTSDPKFSLVVRNINLSVFVCVNHWCLSELSYLEDYRSR